MRPFIFISLLATCITGLGVSFSFGSTGIYFVLFPFINALKEARRG